MPAISPVQVLERGVVKEVPVNREADAATHRALDLTWQRTPGIIGWLCSTNHKDIALRWIVAAFIFFLLAGLLALAMRVQLAMPDNHFLGPDLYNQFFTVHGTTMMFLFAVPIMEAFAIYLVPLMLGTRNVAFPRLNAFGFYVYLAGGILLYAGLFTNTGADAGWFAYVPLSGPEFSPGKRVDIWADMITLTEIAALVSSVEIIGTVLKQRCLGMALHRIPIFVWAMVVTAFMTLFAMPAVMLVSGMLAMDRLANVNTHFFNPAEGGDVLLYQHLFWFFGHPEVYLIFVPATGFVSAILPTFARRPLFGYTAMVLSLIATGFIAFGLWVHHMFATPVPNLGRSFFTGASMMIAIPNGIQIFCWLGTLWGGKPMFQTPLLFILGFFFTFVLGGLSGIVIASVPLDLQVHETYFIVAHFHYVLIGGSIFPLFAAFYYWFPKWTGRMLDTRLGTLNFWLFFIGFNLTFFPMHILGLNGMTRRIYTYGSETGWSIMNLLASMGAGILGVGVLTFLVNVMHSLKRGPFAGDNPWGASTLEWATTSPPQSYNFLYHPTVRGREPLWEQAVISPVVTGLSSDLRETLCTTILEGVEDHRYELAGDSIWPLLLAIVVGGSISWGVFTAWAIPVGAFLSLLALTGWFWHGKVPGWLTSSKQKKVAPLRLAAAFNPEAPSP